MAKRPTTARKRFDIKKRYRVTLKAPVQVGRRTLIPADRHTVSGKVANENADKIIDVVEVK